MMELTYEPLPWKRVSHKRTPCSYRGACGCRNRVHQRLHELERRSRAHFNWFDRIDDSAWGYFLIRA